MRESEKKIARIAGFRYVPVDHPIPKKPKVLLIWIDVPHDGLLHQILPVHNRCNEEWSLATTHRAMGHVVSMIINVDFVK